MSDKKRYQNCTTMNLSVLRETVRGVTSYSLGPGQKVNLTEEEVQASKDAHRNPEDNAFDKGWIKEIPAGQESHPDAPRLVRNPSIASAQQIVAAMDADALKELVGKQQDHRGVIQIRRAVDMSFGETERKRPDVKAFIAKAEKLFDQQDTRIDNALDELKDKYAVGR